MLNQQNTVSETELISVIVPNYNHAAYLPARIESILNQTYQQIEIIILDDASSDSSRQVLKQYEHHEKVKTIIYNNQNSGSTFIQWLAGLALASGEYVWIAESDDVAHLDFLKVMSELMRKDEAISLGFCQTEEINEQGISVQNLPNPYHPDELEVSLAGQQFIKRYMIDSNAIVNVSAVLFRRQKLLAHLDELNVFKFVGDWFLYVNVLVDSNLIISAKVLNYFRSHAETTRSQRDVSNWTIAYEEILKVQKLLYQQHQVEKDIYLEKVARIQNQIFMNEHMESFLKKHLGSFDKELCIYGAGTMGQYYANKLKSEIPELTIKFFIDKKAENGAYVIDGITVYSLKESFEHSIPTILIASLAFIDEIIDELSEHGLREKILNLEFK